LTIHSSNGKKLKLIIMIYAAIGLFLVAAIFGIIITSAILRGQPTPKPIVFIHGILAAIALGIVVYYVATNSGKNPIVSLVLLVVAALGGFVLFARDMTKKPGPIALVAIHALFAVSGVLGLVLFILP
jgi:carbon starvation protein CstA